MLKSVPGLGRNPLPPPGPSLGIFQVAVPSQRKSESTRIHRQVSSTCSEVVAASPLPGVERKKAAFLFPRHAAGELVSMTAERGNKSQALTYRGIKGRPLGKQTMTAGGCWRGKSIGFFHSSSHTQAGLCKGEGVGAGARRGRVVL